MFLYSIIPSYIYYHIVEYFLHSLGHNSKYGLYIYKYHKKHHNIHYPLINYWTINLIKQIINLICFQMD